MRLRRPLRKLILVRHSQPEIEHDKPASIWKLSRTGRSRCELLSARLRGFNPGVIWCSKEPKALETAQIVANALGVPIRIAEGLEEHHRSNVSFFPTKNEFEEAVERFYRAPDQLVLGTETAQQALGRISAAIDGVIKAEPADSIIVTHGTVLTLYVASATGVRPICFWRRLGLPSFVVLTLPDRHIHSIFEDVVEHGTHG